jgi:hypothetical protein
MTLKLSAALFATLLMSGPAQAQVTAAQLLEKVKADIAADASRVWSLTRKAQIFDDDGKLVRTTVARRDKGKWTLALVNGAAPDAKMLEKFNEGAAKGSVAVPRYHDLKDFIGPNTKLMSENATQAVYRTVPLPKNAVMFNDTDLSPHLAGDIVVMKAAAPYVASLTVVNSKPFKVSIATVSKFDMLMRFAPGPDSLPVALERSNNVVAKAIFKTIINKNRVELSDHR